MVNYCRLVGLDDEVSATANISYRVRLGFDVVYKVHSGSENMFLISGDVQTRTGRPCVWEERGGLMAFLSAQIQPQLGVMRFIGPFLPQLRTCSHVDRKNQ